MGLIQRLSDGPVDVVGDVHGEIDALRVLLAHLGYNANGEHPRGRRLVFVGDLCDRGPDSVAVVELVRPLVERGLAQCIAGNHELNVLRGDHKQGNRWIMDTAHPENAREYRSRTASPEQREAILRFFATLPLALERSDLRVVHASWDDRAVDTLRAATVSSIDAFATYEKAMKRTLVERGLVAAGKAELELHKHGLEDPTYAMPLLSALGACEEQRQMLNPVRVLTSGPERATDKQFFSTGKWRFCDRVQWWHEYTADTPVVFGHYWRGMQHGDKPDLFHGTRETDWVGPKRNAYCVDFSVGRRFQERRGLTEAPFRSRLAALQWPDRTITFDNGQRLEAE